MLSVGARISSAQTSVPPNPAPQLGVNHVSVLGYGLTHVAGLLASDGTFGIRYVPHAI